MNGARDDMSGDSDIFSLLYLSESTIPFSEQDLRELLTKAREKNSHLDITGMLLFKGGNFLQVLEGPQETVLPLYEKIGKDPRHARVTVLFEGISKQRDFPDWSMGFHDLSAPNTIRIPGFSYFLDSSLTTAHFVDANHAKRLLLLFKEDQLVEATHSQAQTGD